MNNDEQYVPDAEDVRADYAMGGARDTIGDIDYSAIPELKAEFDRFLARVRRDAAAEAWTDCVSEASALGWLHPSAALDMLDHNPHEETP